MPVGRNGLAPVYEPPRLKKNRLLVLTGKVGMPRPCLSSSFLDFLPERSSSPCHYWTPPPIFSLSLCVFNK